MNDNRNERIVGYFIYNPDDDKFIKLQHDALVFDTENEAKTFIQEYSDFFKTSPNITTKGITQEILDNNYCIKYCDVQKSFLNKLKKWVTENYAD